MTDTLVNITGVFRTDQPSFTDEDIKDPREHQYRRPPKMVMNVLVKAYTNVPFSYFIFTLSVNQGQLDDGKLPETCP